MNFVQMVMHMLVVLHVVDVCRLHHKLAPSLDPVLAYMGNHDAYYIHIAYKEFRP